MPLCPRATSTTNATMIAVITAIASVSAQAADRFASSTEEHERAEAGQDGEGLQPAP
jgi:hypothetical protein